jgi:hypothetical protein
MRLFLAFCLLLLSGCASNELFPGSMYFPGRDLVPGKSTTRDVEAVLGKPAEEMPAGSGDTVWFYPGGPDLRYMYAVQFTPEGVVRKVDQRLEEVNVQRLRVDTSRQQAVRFVFGPPQQVSRVERLEREVWVYKMYDGMGLKMILSLQFSGDGILREYGYARDPQEISGAK